MNKALNALMAKHPDRIRKFYRDPDGIWLELNPGWRASESDYVHQIHEMTSRDIIAAFREVHPCDCDDCQSQGATPA